MLKSKTLNMIIMKNSRVLGFLLTALLFISSTSLFGQKIEPKKRVTEPDTTITSKIMGKDYQLYISFPRSYSIKDTTKYPVLYVLDGRGAFPLFNFAIESREIAKELDDVIIVGIGCGLDQASTDINRSYDFTPSRDTILDRSLAKRYGISSGAPMTGGAEKFLQCITTEIIPYVDTHYKTTNDRGIMGHSYGGLFTAYCLLNSNGIFTRYGISSPSLWWNNGEILNQAISFFSKNKTWDIPSTKVFIGVGKKEGPKMVPDMVKFSMLLESKAYKNVSLNWQIFEDETHSSVIPACLNRALSVLYGRKK
jgi:predicted alpha/beta superfamily hydrolase